MELSTAAAQAIAEGALAKAHELGINVSCSVVTAQAYELTTVRMDRAAWFTAEVSRTKARTAATMRRATADLEGLKAAYPELLELIDSQLPFQPTTLPGGIVITDGEQVIGGVGISGAHPDQDVVCAEAGIASWRGQDAG